MFRLIESSRATVQQKIGIYQKELQMQKNTLKNMESVSALRAKTIESIQCRTLQIIQLTYLLKEGTLNPEDADFVSIGMEERDDLDIYRNIAIMRDWILRCIPIWKEKGFIEQTPS